jgi:hypothetical protein
MAKAPPFIERLLTAVRHLDDAAESFTLGNVVGNARSQADLAPGMLELF